MNKTEQAKFDALEAENASLKAMNEELLKEKGVDTILAEKDATISSLQTSNDELKSQVSSHEKTIEQLMDKVAKQDKESKDSAPTGTIKHGGTKYKLAFPKCFLKGKLVSEQTLKEDPELIPQAIEAKILIEI